MTPPLTPTEIAALVQLEQADCNEFVNGRCDTRGCFVRGGWTNGPTGGFTPTCRAKQTIALIAEVTESRNAAPALLEGYARGLADGQAAVLKRIEGLSADAINRAIDAGHDAGGDAGNTYETEWVRKFRAALVAALKEGGR